MLPCHRRRMQGSLSGFPRSMSSNSTLRNGHITTDVELVGKLPMHTIHDA